MIKELKEAQIDGEQLIIETSNDTEVFDARFLAAALMLQVAKGDGRISEIETASMLQLLEAQYDIHSSEALAIINQAMIQMAENPDLVSIVRQLATIVDDQQKEDMVLMMLRLIAADGRKDAEELDSLAAAIELLAIDPDALHRAYDRYFEEKQP